MPPYLGVSTDNKFYIEIDEVTFQACPGIYSKDVRALFKFQKTPSQVVATTLFTNDIGRIYDICKIVLNPNPDPKQSYFIDLNDDKVLISTLDTN